MTLKDFLLNKMKMSHIYQPVIIKQMLINDGKASLEEIAKILTTLDQEAVEDNIAKLKKYPKEVLNKHGVAKIEKNNYELTVEYGDTKDNLIKICEEKILGYINSRGDDPSTPNGWRAKRVKLLIQNPYCTLCGSRPDRNSDVELDIDHIVPVSKGGSDDESNLQVLCAKCNRAKGNSLLLSSKEAIDNYLKKQDDCIFCNLPKERINNENQYLVIFDDAFPVTKGHTLIIPKRHVKDALELNDRENLEILQNMKHVCNKLQSNDPTILGFNIGYNVGEVAGQTVLHCHLHIIPRRIGDVENPTGGIRNIIPGMGRYK
jgi:ATP adenylyltransferase